MVVLFKASYIKKGGRSKVEDNEPSGHGTYINRKTIRNTRKSN